MTDDRLQKLSTTQTKKTTQNTAKLNYPGSVASYDPRPGNEVGLFYSSRAHTGQDTDTHTLRGVLTARNHSIYFKYGCNLIAGELGVSRNSVRNSSWLSGSGVEGAVCGGCGVETYRHGNGGQR